MTVKTSKAEKQNNNINHDQLQNHKLGCMQKLREHHIHNSLPSNVFNQEVTFILQVRTRKNDRFNLKKITINKPFPIYLILNTKNHISHPVCYITICLYRNEFLNQRISRRKIYSFPPLHMFDYLLNMVVSI